MIMELMIGITTVIEIQNKVKQIAEGLEATNKVVDATLQALSSESSGTFIDSLGEAGHALVNFTISLVKALFSAIALLGKIAENIRKADEDASTNVRGNR